MTTIAYRDDVLCADTQVTWGSTVDGYTQKVFAKGPLLYALTGNGAVAHLFRDWIESGAKYNPPQLGDGDNSASGFIFPGDDLILHFHSGHVCSLRLPFYAAGSGADLALGAMAMGATAYEAIMVAKRFDIHTGGAITKIVRATQCKSA